MSPLQEQVLSSAKSSPYLGSLFLSVYAIVIKKCYTHHGAWKKYYESVAKFLTENIEIESFLD